MKKIKRFFLNLLFILLVGSQSSCSLVNLAGDSGLVTLNVVTMFGGADYNTRTYQKINADFMENYPNITVHDQSAISDEIWKESVLNSFIQDQEPDVLFFFTDATAEELVALDKFVMVETIRSQYPEYGRDIKEDSLRSAAAPNGINYALPLTGYYEGLFCNLDLFEQYNLELPTTWERFVEAVEVFRQNDIIPVAVSLGDIPHYWIEHLILSQGGVEGHSLNPTDTAPISWVQGLGYLKNLVEMGAFPEEGVITNNDEANELFASKKAAMQLDGSWYANGVADKEHTTIIAFPTVPGGQNQYGSIISGFSSGFYITEKAWQDQSKREAAVKFVMAHTTSASIARYWWGAGSPAAECLAPVGMQRLLHDGAEMAATATEMDTATDSRLNPEAFKILTTYAADIAYGRKSAAEVVQQMITKNKQSF